jgi:O-antigen/teichoic acid export membrane protein
VAGSVGVLLVGLVSTIALARWLGPSDRGLLALMAYTVELTVAVGTLAFTYAVAYYVSRADPPRGAILGNSLAVGAVLAIVCIPLFAIFADQIARVISDGRGAAVWPLVGFLVVAVFLDWCIHNQLLGKLQFGRLNLLLVVSRVAALVAIVVFVGIAGWGVVGGLLSSMSASIVMIAGCLLALRDVRPTIDFQLMRRMFAYGARVSVGWIFQMVNYRADVFILQAFVPLAAVGEYVVAGLVAGLALTFGSALSTSVTTLVARYDGTAAQKQTVGSSMRHAVILTAVGVLALAVFGTLLINIAFGPAYHGATTPMYILLPGMVFLGVGSVASGNLRGLERPGASSILAGITVAVTLTLDLILIPKFGVNGAAVASTVAYTIFGCLNVAVVSRLTKIPARTLVVPGLNDATAYWRAAAGTAGAVVRLPLWMRARAGRDGPRRRR